jgi:hypothetical protein
MLVCSSPQLIAAYHVLLRLLEPRHPPCALICFKNSQIFKSLTSIKVTRFYNFPNMSKNFVPFTELADVSVLNRSPTSLSSSRRNQVRILLISIFKELPRRPSGPLSRGGYRSRTDDPLLAKQML